MDEPKFSLWVSWASLAMDCGAMDTVVSESMAVEAKFCDVFASLASVAKVYVISSPTAVATAKMSWLHSDSCLSMGPC